MKLEIYSGVHISKTRFNSIMMEALSPGKSTIGIDVLNNTRTLVHLRDLLESLDFRCNEGELPFVVGTETGGRNAIYDLVHTPHLL